MLDERFEQRIGEVDEVWSDSDSATRPGAPLGR